ncbi:HEAT repeat domain-containing protein [Phycicoccus sp. KQZ13P-1]|nr:HEAT repeat domain-containing protein [Phycicoccus mangrovi]
MVPNNTQNPEARLAAALTSTAASVRLSTALAAGSHPRPEYVEHLIARCAVESDFFVRDMLTWALLQHDREVVLPRVLAELSSDVPQARSQALHTLSKIGDRQTWPAITPSLLFDTDDEVARAAWRTAAGLVPPGHEARLAADLATQLGRGGPEVMLSLSRALLTLGDAAVPVVAQACGSSDDRVRTHALLTERLRKDPQAGFEDSVEDAKRARALHGAPLVGE